jgi:hypothetical protein
MTMKTFLLPMASEVHAQKRRPSPLKMEATARMVPPVRASASEAIPGFALRITSWARGESWEMRPIPAETFRNSIPQSIHHWGVPTARSKVKESAADTPPDGEGENPAGSHPFGGFRYSWADAVTATKKMIPQM